MRRIIATACVLAMISGALWAQQPSPHTPRLQKTNVAKKKASLKNNVPAVAPAPQVPAQTMPPVPETLMNSAPVEPSVTMQGGMLTIDAPNSTLSDVLSGIRKATGAAIEGASPSERVAVRLGPGKPQQVIAALLRGTPYDYVIIGASGHPDVVTRVLLTQSAGEPMQGSPGAARPQEAAHPQEAVEPPSADDNIPRERTPDETQPNPDAEPDQAQPQPQAQQPEQNQPKTPEQLFKELQQLEQQKQQPPK